MAGRPMDRFAKQGERQGSLPESEEGGPSELGFETHADTSGVMLDLVLADGSRVGMPYALLTAAFLNPTGGMLLEYPDRTVSIEGRNLLPLYHNVIAHLVRRVVVATTAFDEGTASSWVKTIVVTPRE